MRLAKWSPPSCFLALLLVLSPACSSNGSRAAFTTTQEDFYQRHSTICVAPVTASAGLQDERTEALAASIVGKLRDGGFRAPQVQDYISAREAVTASAPGCFDPATGEADRERCDAQERFFRAVAQRELGCTAFLHASVVRVVAPWRNGIAFWDDTRDSLLTGVHWEGWAEALSLWLEIADVEGAPLYWRAAGIELAVRLRSPTAKLWDPIPVGQQLRDEVRRRRAVLLGLGPLAGAPTDEVARCLDDFDAPREGGLAWDAWHERAHCEHAATGPPNPGTGP